ncbi:MAG TPA: surface-adhesin E family protein [Gemmatimonadaceae bacterium]|nr:surface-adhesin E family protein [Gemmatimonadaceae bacterium]
MRTTLFALALGAAALVPARASAQWKQIGKTSNGNPVFISPRSLKTVDGIVHVRLRVLFEPPVKTRQGTWVSSQTIAMVNCSNSRIAAKENTYYADARGSKVVERTVNKIPGYGPALEGTMAYVAVEYLCKKK